MSHFTTVVDVVRKRLSSISSPLEDKRAVWRTNEVLPNFYDSPATRLLDIIKRVFEWSGNGTILRRRLSLDVLVDLATFCETTDLRDTVFALLSLANDIDTHALPDPMKSKMALSPDYSQPLLEVFARFVLHCCQQSSSLDIICRPWAPIENLSDMPSWIASRDNLPFGNASAGSRHRLHGKPLVGNSGKRVYNAHNDTIPEGRLGIDEATNRCNGSFFAKGIVLGEIETRSPRMASGVITKECLHTLLVNEDDRIWNMDSPPDVFWRTLCADRDGQGNPGPLTYRSAMTTLQHIILQAEITGSRAPFDANLMLASQEEKENKLYRYHARAHTTQPELFDRVWDYARGKVSAVTIDTEELLELGVPEDVKDFLQTVRNVVWNRRMFRATRRDGGRKPLVGIIPRYTRVGDKLCIIYGCSVPVVLRKLMAEGGRPYWQLIGEAYVHGYMDGEALSALSPEELKSIEVEFELR